MITIKNFVELIEYKITEGAQYQWSCYGNKAWTMSYEDFGTGPDQITIFIVFDTEDQTVYEMQAWDGANKKEYRWIHPDYVEAHEKESILRNIPVSQSIDDRKFVDLEVEEDMLEKAHAIFRRMEYDKRVSVELNLPQGDIHRLMEMAHEKDMTFNKFIESVLIDDIRRKGFEI